VLVSRVLAVINRPMLTQNDTPLARFRGLDAPAVYGTHHFHGDGVPCLAAVGRVRARMAGAKPEYSVFDSRHHKETHSSFHRVLCTPLLASHSVLRAMYFDRTNDREWLQLSLGAFEAS
jgi:hypothetical protein